MSRVTGPARGVVDTVAAAIADIDPAHLDDREVIAYLAGISEATTGLLPHRPDLKAHADLVMDLANRVFHANAAAEERGCRRAVAWLREPGAFEAWFRDAEGLDDDATWGETYAAYLESRLSPNPTAEENTTDERTT